MFLMDNDGDRPLARGGGDGMDIYHSSASMPHKKSEPPLGGSWFVDK